MIQNLWWAAGYNIVAIPLAAGVLAAYGILLAPAVARSSCRQHGDRGDQRAAAAGQQRRAMYRTIAVTALLLSAPHAVSGQDTLTLAEVYRVAEQQNPMLRAVLARVDAARAAESSASLPPDPALQLGVMNASLPGLETNMPGAMLPSIQLMQMLPVGGKLRLTGEIARRKRRSVPPRRQRSTGKSVHVWRWPGSRSRRRTGSSK
jgi:hypothetical protein